MDQQPAPIRHTPRKYVSGHVLDGLTANIFKLATGHYPGQRKNGERL
jgi:hypothetical protein